MKNLWLLLLFMSSFFSVSLLRAQDNYVFFSPSMIETHLSGYNGEERSLINKDLEVVREICFSEKACRHHGTMPFYLATAGAPGSRKSTILERFLETHPEFKEGVYLDPDQRALKFMVHTYYNISLSALKIAESLDYNLIKKAAYEKWRGASNYITLRLMEEGFDKKLNIIHGATSTGGLIPKFYEKLKESGYNITLILCSCEDAFRYDALTYRNQNQRLYQSSPDDEVTKGKFFTQKMPHYFAWADSLYLYWSDDLKTSERLAAVFSNGMLMIHDANAYQLFVEKYEKDRQILKEEGVNLPSWQEVIHQYWRDNVGKRV